MNDFAAIDFEIANQHRYSVCSVGIVVVRNGSIKNKYYSLVKPVPNFFTFWTSRVHGLTKSDVANAPTFNEVWERVTPYINELPLVAHNSAFDESYLKAAFKLYEMPYPDYEFYCTYKASRRILGNLLPNHQL